MPTQLNKINELPQGVPSGGDYMTFHDAAGTCKRAQWSDIQENTAPPQLWRRIILDDVRLATSESNRLSAPPLTERTNVSLNNYIGIYIPEFRRMVYPRLVSLPFGDNTQKIRVTSETEINEGSGEDGDTITGILYNGSTANQGNNCAVGYAYNFSKYNHSGYGIGIGNWYLPTASEFRSIIIPRYSKLKYAASLFGEDWGDKNEFWTCLESGTPAQSYACGEDCQFFSVPKSNPRKVLLMAKVPRPLTQRPK